MYCAAMMALFLISSTIDQSKIGPGTEVFFDNGYFPSKDLPWVSLPTYGTVVGEYEGLLVVVRKGDSPPYDEFHLFGWPADMNGRRKLRIVSLRSGRLEFIRPCVGIREGPPDKNDSEKSKGEK